MKLLNQVRSVIQLRHDSIGTEQAYVQLMAQLLYGSGLRLIAYVRLRVKDIDFGRNQLMVRSARACKTERRCFPISSNHFYPNNWKESTTCIKRFEIRRWHGVPAFRPGTEKLWSRQEIGWQLDMLL